MPEAATADLTYLCETFGLGELRDARRIARGATGAVWRVDARSPASSSVMSYAAKELFGQVPSPHGVQTEVRFTNRCRRAGVPSPHALATPTGSYVIHDPAGRAWRLYGWVDGHVPERTDVHAVLWLAGQLGRIHALAIRPDDDAQPHPFYQRVDVDWAKLAHDAATAHAAWLPDLETRLDHLINLSDLVNTAPDHELIMCHRDPKATNILVEPSGQSWLIDWDNSGPMAPVREFGLLVMHHLTDLDALTAISTRYRDHGGSARLGSAQGFATGLAVWLNFLEGQARILLDENTTADDRQFAKPRVTGLLSSMPTLEQLDRAAESARRRH